MGQATRETHKYVFKIGNQVKHFGFTTDLSRREKQLNTKWSGGRIKKIGRRTTKEAARRWSKEK